MLCQRCQELLTSSAEVSDTDSFPHHTCIEDLKTSVEARCMICATVWFGYTPDEQQKLDQLEGYEFETFGLTNVFVSRGDNSHIDLVFELGPDAAEITDISRREFTFRARKETEEDKSLEKDRLVLDSLQFSSSTNSPEVFSLANGWINKCLENHPSCNQSTDTKWYPTRLLNFRSSDEGKDPVIYLVETNGVTLSEPYMTLSHSWGECHTMTLNKQSYQSLQHGIPLSSLSPTFRDACFVARQVGVNYIWIDALCIFQDKDDLSDWSREASLMNKVYLYSHCNIVAADNTNSSKPIFRKRNPKSLNPPTTETLIRSRLSSSQSEESSSIDKFILGYMGYWKPVRNAHINTRGWVMQERFLSPRALHFGAHQVYWECRESMALETNPAGLECFGGVPFKALMNAPHGHHSWSKVVMMYSACALSFPSDKLVAVSALARLYASYLSDEYVAGMWHSCLQDNLLWLAYGRDHDEPTRYEVYTAPTWSWASIKGEVITVSYEPDRVKYLYEVDDYKLEYVTEDKMGAIRSGWLRLSGHLKPLKLLRETETIWSLIIDNIEYDPRRYIDEETKDVWSSVWLDEPHSDFDVENEKGTLYCMLARHHLFNETGEASNMWDFLLLQQVDDTHDTFRRIGMARTRTGNVKNPYPTNSLNQGASSRSLGIEGSGTAALPWTANEGGVQSIYVI